MLKKLLLSSMLTMLLSVCSSPVFAAPLLSPEFLEACKSNNLEVVKTLIAREENSSNFNSPGFDFCSPLSAAAHFNARKILSHLICHPKIDINKNMVRFAKDICFTEIPYDLPLFFGLLRENDYINLKLLLDNPKFEIESLKEGLNLIRDGGLEYGWKLAPQTAEVLRNSRHHEFFNVILSTDVDWELDDLKPYCGFKNYN